MKHQAIDKGVKRLGLVTCKRPPAPALTQKKQAAILPFHLHFSIKPSVLTNKGLPRANMTHTAPAVSHPNPTNVPDLLQPFRPEDSWLVFEEDVNRFADLKLLKAVLERTAGQKPYQAHIDKWRNWAADAAQRAAAKAVDDYDIVSLTLLWEYDRAQKWGYNIGFTYIQGYVKAAAEIGPFLHI